MDRLQSGEREPAEVRVERALVPVRVAVLDVVFEVLVAINILDGNQLSAETLKRGQ